MQMTFKGKKISSILGILPEKVGFFDEEASNYTFPVNQTLRLKKVMGFDRHRLSKAATTVTDIAVCGLDYMFEQGWIEKEEIGALIVVSLCPDHFLPHNSNIIQGRCSLGQDVICLDIPQGCCGYIVGLMEAFFLLEHMRDKKVVLVNADVLMHKISEQDRNEYPVMGDAGAISIVENDDKGKPIYLDLRMDGGRRDCLKIPAGGFRMPSTAETAVLKDGGDGNLRSLDQMYMDGTEVFNFVVTDVPPMIRQIYGMAGKKIENTELFLFHQPNRFMVNKLADKLGIDKTLVPMDLVEKIGNPSGASIPLVAAIDLRDKLMERNYDCCLSGFGSGLAYGAILMDFGILEKCEVIETKL